MKKVKIFLASSEDLRDENLELSDLVEHLNLILEPQDVHIYLEKWEYLLNREEGIGNRYNDKLEESDICMVVFGREFGSYTERELRSAYERVCQEGVNPSKLYVYFKNLEWLKEDLRRFRDSFPDVYGHFTGKFSDSNSLKNDFLLQFQLFQSQNLKNSCPVEVKDSKVTVFGKDLFIDLMKIPFLGNNETYTDLLEDIKDLKEWIEEHEPDHKKYSEKARKLREKEEKRDKMEQSIWSTALQIASLSGKKSSQRMHKAIELFNNGDNKAANAILNESEIFAEINNEIKEKNFHKKAAHIHIENLIQLIEELKMKVKVVENELKDGWGEVVIKLMKKIIESTKEVYGVNSDEYLESLLKLSIKYKHLGNFKKAEKIEKDLLNKALTLWGDKDERTATIFSNIGSTSWGMGRLQEALDYTQRSLEIRVKIKGEYEIDTLIVFNNKFCILSDLKKNQEALSIGLKCLSICEKVLDEKSPLIASVYNNIGSIYGLLNDYEKAIKFIEKGLIIREKLFPTKHPDIATSYNNIGINHLKINRLEEAYEFIEKALKIRESIWGLYHPSTATSYSNLGSVYRAKGLFTEAIKHKEKALLIRERLFSSSFRKTLSLYTQIADLYYKIKEYGKSLDLRLKALEIKRELKKQDIVLLCDIGLTYCQLKQYKKGINYFIEAENDSLKADIKNNVILKTIYKNLALAYKKLKDVSQCLKYRLLYLELKLKEGDFSSTETATAYNNVGAQYRDLREYDKALEYIGIAYEISKKTDRTEDEATYLNRLGRVYALMGDKVTAIAKFEEAISLLPEDHPDALDSKERLKDLEQNN